MKQNNKGLSKNRLGLVLSVVFIGVILFVSFVLYANRQLISDLTINLFFEPSASVADLGSDLKLTDTGQRIYYATQPKMLGSTDFNDFCPRLEEKNPILGCYTSKDRIYMYDVSTNELDGIEQVTAAHELLHAIWYRMSDDERQTVGDLLVEEYDNITDEALKSRMDYYERNEPGQFTNELHSIIGTELVDISNELEAHYANYFSDRSTVVGYYTEYHSVYDELYDRAEQLYSDIESMGQQIIELSDTYQTDVNQLTADIADFNSRANSGFFSSQQEFYSERSVLVSRTDELESRRNSINDLVNSYNAKVAEYQEVAAKIDTLNESIDSMQSVDEVPTL